MAEVADLTIGPPGRPEVSDTPLETVDVEPPTLEALAATPEQVRRILATAGIAAGALLADEELPGVWEFTKDELDLLAPAVASIINRQPRLQRAFMRSDEATVVGTLAAYGYRNLTALREAHRPEPEPDEVPDVDVERQDHSSLPGARAPDPFTVG